MPRRDRSRWRKGALRAERSPAGGARRTFRPLLIEQFESRELLTSVTLTPVADNTIFQDNTSNSDGAGSSLFAGETIHAGARRALLKFDLAGNVPAGAHIDSVTLQLHVVKDRGQSNAFGVYLMQASWGEGSSVSSGDGAPATLDDATWLTRFFNASPAQPWTHQGGDFDATASATTMVGTGGGTSTFQWTSTQLAADVQGWLNAPSTQLGWMIKEVDESVSGSAEEFDSRESSTVANRPTLTINFTAGNAAPVVAGSTTASVAHGATFNFTGTNKISVSDTDGGTTTESVALAVTSGALTLTTSGVTVTSGASGTGAVTISGTLTNLNTALATLTYTAPNSGASATLSATANDGLTSGNTLSTAITLTNVAPAVAGPTTASVAHAGTLSFNGAKTISVSDTDGSGTESVALAVTSGTLTLTTSGVNVTSGASGTSAVTISGTLANLNTALATLAYVAPNSGASATLTATPNDGVASGTPLSTTITLTNVAPVLTGPTTASVAHAATLNFNGAKTISLSDTDGGSSTESVALSVTSGTLTLTTSGVTVTNGASGTGAVTISGTLANLNTALATLAYVAPNSGASATLTATANDGTANGNTLSTTITLTNAAPVVAGPTTASVAHAATLNLSGAKLISVSDTDGGSTTESVALSVTSGTLTLTTSGVTVTNGASGTGAVTISGTLANLNTALATLAYVAPNSGASATLTATANDGTASSNPLTTAITLTNVAPVVAGPTTASVTQGGTFDFSGANTISVGDTDGGDNFESVSLAVSLGTISLTTSAVTVTSGASGTPAVTISGAVTSLNSALATLAYLAPNSVTSATLTAIANDGTAGSNTLSVAITIRNSGNQPPTINSISDATIAQDSGLQTVNLTGISAGTGESQALSVTAKSDNVILIPDPAVQYSSPSASGSLTYTPAAGQSGTAKITVTVRDAGLNGTLGDGDDGLTTTTFTVQVLSPDQINHMPSFVAGGNASGTDEDSTISVPGWATAISPGPAQESTQTVSFLVTTDNDALFSVKPAVDSSGNLTFTPAPNAHGTVIVSVKIKDSGGTAAGGVDTSSPQTFNIVITKPHPLHNSTGGPGSRFNADVTDSFGTGLPDHHIAPIDALTIVNFLNIKGLKHTLPNPRVPDLAGFGGDFLGKDSQGNNLFAPFVDVLPDNILAPSDALEVINFLNAHQTGEGEAQPAIAPSSADSVFQQLGQTASAPSPPSDLLALMFAAEADSAQNRQRR